MQDQFFGKPFLYTLAGLACVFGVSILAFDTVVVFPLLVLGLLIVFSLTIWRLELGVAILFAELFANSHGHLLSANLNGFSVSLRMAVFLGLMLGYLVLVLSKRARVPFSDQRLLPFLGLGLAAGAGFLLGGLAHPQLAFRDGNAYLYAAAILPILSVRWTPLLRRMLLQVFAAAAMWVVLLTLGLAFLFTHVPEGSLGGVYRFIRDTRTGELTKMNGIFRVFIQAQFSDGVFLFLLTPLLFQKKPALFWTRTVWVLAGVFATLLISLSRSFWVGMVVGMVFALVLARGVLAGSWKRFAAGVGRLIASTLAGAVLLVTLLLLPVGFPGIDFSNFATLFGSRTTGLSDQAIDSRWKLLDPMLDHIARNPLLGYGFGQEIEFITDDPRIRSEIPDGRWRTSSFEWGWLELWIKMGILGPAAFLFLFWRLIRGLKPLIDGEHAWLGVGLISALVMLYATHVFSPYLNHPLGIGFLLFLVPFLHQTEKAHAWAEWIPSVLRAPVGEATSVLPSQENTAP